MIHFDYSNIFHMGWNHQLENLTYPKPNFLTFRQYIKWFPKKVENFVFPGRDWRGESNIPIKKSWKVGWFWAPRSEDSNPTTVATNDFPMDFPTVAINWVGH